MPCLAAISWSDIALVVFMTALVVVVPLVPFLIIAFRSARAIAYTKTDDFRLGHANMWTEPHHNPKGGSIQLMRLIDGYFVVISVGVSTVKVFATPDRADITQYRKLREFPVPSAFERLRQPSHQRRSDELLFLERVRCVIGWPKSVSDLVSSVESVDGNLLVPSATRL